MLGNMLGSEGFPQPPTSMAGGAGLLGGGVLNLLKSHPEMLGVLLMSLGSLGQGGQGGQPSDPLQTLLRLNMMKQMMPNRPMGMEGSPNMPGQLVGSGGGMGDPMSWLSSLFGGSGGR